MGDNQRTGTDSELVIQPRAIERQRNANNSYVSVVNLQDVPKTLIKFRMPADVSPTLTSMCQIWFPDEYIDLISERVSTYAQELLQEEAYLSVNNVSFE